MAGYRDTPTRELWGMYGTYIYICIYIYRVYRVPIIRIIVFGGVHWGPPIYGDCQVTWRLLIARMNNAVNPKLRFIV